MPGLGRWGCRDFADDEEGEGKEEVVGFVESAMATVFGDFKLKKMTKSKLERGTCERSRTPKDKSGLFVTTKWIFVQFGLNILKGKMTKSESDINACWRHCALVEKGLMEQGLSSLIARPFYNGSQS